MKRERLGFSRGLFVGFVIGIGMLVMSIPSEAHEGDAQYSQYIDEARIKQVPHGVAETFGASWACQGKNLWEKVKKGWQLHAYVGESAGKTVEFQYCGNHNSISVGLSPQEKPGVYKRVSQLPKEDEPPIGVAPTDESVLVADWRRVQSAIWTGKWPDWDTLLDAIYNSRINLRVKLTEYFFVFRMDGLMMEPQSIYSDWDKKYVSDGDTGTVFGCEQRDFAIAPYYETPSGNKIRVPARRVGLNWARGVQNDDLWGTLEPGQPVSATAVAHDHTVSGTFKLSPLKIQQPSGGAHDFLVSTRDPDDSITGSEHVIQARTKSCLDPGDLSTAKWTVQGVETDGHTPSFTTNPVDSTSFVSDFPTFTQADIPLKAEREEDGREQSRIGAKITVKADEFSNHVTITQDTEAHNVIRQEYEDVEMTESGSGVSVIPDASEFQTGNTTYPQSSSNNTLPPVTNEVDYMFDSYLLDDNKFENMRNAYDYAVNQTNFQTTSWPEFYHITSNYRFPEYNDNAGGVADSQHLFGNAVDLWVGDNNIIHNYQILYPVEADNHRDALGLLMCREGNATQRGTYSDRVHVDWRPENETSDNSACPDYNN